LKPLPVVARIRIDRDLAGESPFGLVHGARRIARQGGSDIRGDD
jgi:hypothetical protein